MDVRFSKTSFALYEFDTMYIYMNSHAHARTYHPHKSMYSIRPHSIESAATKEMNFGLKKRTITHIYRARERDRVNEYQAAMSTLHVQQSHYIIVVVFLIFFLALPHPPLVCARSRVSVHCIGWIADCEHWAIVEPNIINHHREYL